MKRTKREENGIIIYLVLYFVLTVGIIFYGVTSLLPQINEIEAKKIVTKEVQINLDRIEKSGLTFDEFKASAGKGDKNRVITEILKNISESFYSKYLVNAEYTTYNEFLTKKQAELNSEDNKLLVEEKENKIINILPSYTDTSIEIGENVLTDYKFINYVESIIESFNLSTSDAIGIGKLKLLEDFTVSTNKSDSLESNIYYIPLHLTLRGTKSSIIDFLFYVENVGNIEVVDNDVILNNNFGRFQNNGRIKILEGDKYSENYNIFEHQIFDIDTLTMIEYIDKSYNFRGENETLVEFIDKNQGNSEFEMTLDLSFYIKGQPTYKIEEFISGVFDKHAKVSKLITKALQSTNLKGADRITVSKSNKLIQEFSKEISILKKNLGKEDKLETIYKRAIKIDAIINPIFNILNK